MVLGPLPAALLTAGGRNGAWDGTESDGSSADRARRDRGHARVVLDRRNDIRGRTGLRLERVDLRPQHVDEPDPGCRRRGGDPAGLQPVRDQRYALLFKPGTYGTSRHPLNFQVGYYTAVAGLGRSPGDVVINGSVYVRNQCDADSCIALNNFWRSLSNLTINVTTPNFGCYSGEFWAVSQAAPMRRVHVNGPTTLMDYCTGPSFASGGFIADSAFDGGTVVNGSQQQWFVRNSSLDGWSNGVWNQVFSGVEGAPAQCFPARARTCGGPYTTLATSPVTREAPYLYVDARGQLQRLRPVGAARLPGRHGPRPDAGRSIPIDKFFIADADRLRSDDQQRAGPRARTCSSPRASTTSTRRSRSSGPTPSCSGSASRRSSRPNGNVAMTVADVPGVDDLRDHLRRGPEELAGAAPGRHRGTRTERQRAADPTALQRRVLPDRRRDGRQGHDQPRGEQRQRRSSTTSGHGAPTTATASAGPSTPPTPASSSTATTSPRTACSSSTTRRPR